MEDSATFLRYIDLFGTKCTFYNEKMPKLYTATGGILSIISIFVCILIFISLSYDDLRRKNPLTTISSNPSGGYKKIKFGKEKIWIPWRISDYNNNEFVNHTGLLYPIIYYYSRIKDNNTKDFNLTTKKLNYKLCSETSMVYETKIYQINVPLNELFCIEMEDLDMGGSWMSEFISYIQFDLYYCEDGIDYNDSNDKCSPFNKIMNYVGTNNSLELSVYYPVVQFQPTNKTNPIIIIYRQYFYHISKYVNKIDRIFLQENVLTDDSGWILKRESNNSYWGLNSINGDTYFIGNNKDLLSKGSNSRPYSFNLYLEPGIIHYKRYYKKIYIIFSDFYPIAYIFFLVMKNISKIFKKAESNKKMIELLFENLKEKPNVFEKNIQKLRIKNYNSINNIGRLSFKSYLKQREELIKKSNNGNNEIFINEKNSALDQKNSPDNRHSRKFHMFNSTLMLKNPNANCNYSIQNNHSSKDINDNQQKISVINNASNQNLMSIDAAYIANINLEKTKNKNSKFTSESIKPQKVYIKGKLFPYKYYFFSVFIKNLNTSKDNFLFNPKFAKIYAFVCQLFDITTYLSLQKEFIALKKTIFDEKSINIIEKTKKININNNNFMKDINDCIGEQKFYILAQGICDKYLKRI